MNVSQSVLELPLPLLLLTHLQILQYPHIDNENFDIHIFDAQKRGLRARIKMMEDLGYWLVNQIEGREIFPVYPCIKPSETIAFRTSFAKYLEALRQSCIKGNDASSVWWRSVQARKSLLEECTGEKFLRLLLAFSTQVLLRLSSNPYTFQSPVLYYSNRLASTQASQRSWIKFASNLLEREQRLMDTKIIHTATKSQFQSKFQSLSTPRLVALKDSKLQDILSQECWRGDPARKILEFFVTLAGLGCGPTEDGKHREPSPVGTLSHLSYSPRTEVQLLPLAAARHLYYLQRLKRPVFSLAEAELAAAATRAKTPNSDSGNMALQNSTFDHAVFALRNHLANEESVRVVLDRATKRLAAEASELQEKSIEKKFKPDALAGRADKTKLQTLPKSSFRKVHLPATDVNAVNMNVVKGFSFWEDKYNFDEKGRRLLQLNLDPCS
ncbi:hypothetical protein C8R41DRAFT_925978 [Lentinula lateritia]|uniref:HAUS augmin-like complex subunit 6 N-terminal domain-containing protein n=1 Tax=Lentinula lateritia TaxID=40482 RepID=A0ABQ8V2W7_9AGAR|nr:hypothetical protein C8R41DRAFT_925978 [Lentinula lateritia]